ncbi:MAG: hypothetical protein ABIX01_12360 [Chitinophagaceae bacterium]
MKRIVLMMAVTVTAVCFTLGACAQDSTRRGPGGRGGRSPEERAKQQTEQMTKALSLTSAQVVKVDSINLKFANMQGGMRGGQGGGGMDMEARMAAMKKTQDEKNAAFKPVLTEKQYADYLKMVEENNARMMERFKNGPGGGGNGGN